VFAQDTLRRTVGKLGYLQATAPVLQPGLKRTILYMGVGTPVNDFEAGNAGGVDALKAAYQAPD
jgi:hypothetical protein